jgi:hypothetical protein
MHGTGVKILKRRAENGTQHLFGLHRRKKAFDDKDDSNNRDTRV